MLNRRPFELNSHHHICETYSIFENWTQNINCDMHCIPHIAVLLKSNFVYIFSFNFRKDMTSFLSEKIYFFGYIHYLLPNDL